MIPFARLMLVAAAVVVPPAMAIEDVALSYRLPQSVERSPNSITVIDREIIRMSGALSIGDALSLVPGVLVGHKDAGMESISYQGLSDEFPRRTQVLVNGRSIFLPTSGGVSWKAIPVQLEDVERIEVIHGPNTALSGSNALLGTINIITRHPRETETFKVGTTFGTNGTRNFSLRSSAAGDVLAATVSMHNYADIDGYDVKSDIAPFTDEMRHRSGLLRVDGDLNRLHTGLGELTMEIGASRETTDLGGFIDPWIDEPQGNEATFESNTIHNYQHLTWRGEYGATFTTVRLAHMDDRVKEIQALVIPPMLDTIYDNGYTGRRNDAEIEVGHRLNHDLRALVGAAYRDEYIHSTALLGGNDPQAVHMKRGFAQMEWAPGEDWVLHAMGAWEQGDLMDTQFAPTIAVNYQFAKGHFLRMAYAEGYRHPMVYEEMADRFVEIPMIGRVQYVESLGGLDPERNRTIDAAWIHRPDWTLETSLRVYQTRLDRLITPYERPYAGLSLHPGVVMDFRNANEMTSRGVEASTMWREHDWIARGTYTYSDVRNESVCGDSLAGSCFLYEDGQPRHNLSVLLGKKLAHGWVVSGTYQYISGYRWIWVDYPNVGDNQFLNLRVAKLWRHGRSDVELSLIGRNLLGEVHDFRTDASWAPAGLVRLVISHL